MVSNLYGLPQPLVEALTPERRRPQLGRFGVTTLIDAPLRRILTMRHFDEISEDVSENIWALLGKMGHKTLEMNKRVSEVWVEQKFGDALLVGVVDYTDDCKVIDFKFTSVWSFVFAGDKSEWEKQLQIYAYLIQLSGKPVASLENWLILRDWNKREAAKSETYPKIPFAKVEYKLWSREAVEAFISGRVSLHLEAQKIEPGADLAHLTCSPEERWDRPTKYAVKKEGKERAERVLDTLDDAEKYILALGNIATGKVGKYFIETRRGESVRCLNYCSVSTWCPYFKGLEAV
jgi:hypothetical protein